MKDLAPLKKMFGFHLVQLQMPLLLMLGYKTKYMDQVLIRKLKHPLEKLDLCSLCFSADMSITQVDLFIFEIFCSLGS